MEHRFETGLEGTRVPNVRSSCPKFGSGDGRSDRGQSGTVAAAVDKLSKSKFWMTEVSASGSHASDER